MLEHELVDDWFKRVTTMFDSRQSIHAIANSESLLHVTSEHCPFRPTWNKGRSSWPSEMVFPAASLTEIRLSVEELKYSVILESIEWYQLFCRGQQDVDDDSRPGRLPDAGL
jgi:hypothetical protein